jgi:hypothetical protein
MEYLQARVHRLLECIPRGDHDHLIFRGFEDDNRCKSWQCSIDTRLEPYSAPVVALEPLDTPVHFDAFHHFYDQSNGLHAVLKSEPRGMCAVKLHVQSLKPSGTALQFQDQISTYKYRLFHEYFQFGHVLSHFGTKALILWTSPSKYKDIQRALFELPRLGILSLNPETASIDVNEFEIPKQFVKQMFVGPEFYYGRPYAFEFCSGTLILRLTKGRMAVLQY